MYFLLSMSFLVKEQVYPMSKCGIRTFVIRKISISWFSYFRHGLGGLFLGEGWGSSYVEGQTPRSARSDRLVRSPRSLQATLKGHRFGGPPPLLVLGLAVCGR
jgi:hypothetical protein